MRAEPITKPITPLMQGPPQTKNAQRNSHTSFCFVLNHIEVAGDLPVEIIPGYSFRKATSEEVQFIKEGHDLLRVFGLHAMSYEHDMLHTEESPGRREGGSVPLPKDKWRYWLI